MSSKTRPNQEKMKVITNLFKNEPGLGAAGGWECCLWETKLTLPDSKNKMVTADHKVWYLKHTVTGHVITSQHKAWNDTVRMAMWIELILEPLFLEEGKLLLWMDNCKLHKVPIIEELFDRLGVNVAFYHQI